MGTHTPAGGGRTRVTVVAAGDCHFREDAVTGLRELAAAGRWLSRRQPRKARTGRRWRAGTSGASDIGTAVIYAVVFAGLLALSYYSGPARYSADYYLEQKFSWWWRLAELRRPTAGAAAPAPAPVPPGAVPHPAALQDETAAAQTHAA